MSRSRPSPGKVNDPLNALIERLCQRAPAAKPGKRAPSKRIQDARARGAAYRLNEALSDHSCG